MSPALRSFAWRYALAIGGIHASFVPLLALLLPRRIETVAPDTSVTALSVVLIVGGVAAAVANLSAGRWTDRGFATRGHRAGAVAGGAIAMVVSHAILAAASSIAAIAVAIVLLQAALNLGFAALAAVMVDYVPDAHKGSVAGLAGTATPIASVLTAAIGFIAPHDAAWPIVACGLLAALLMVPLLLRWPHDLPLQSAVAAPQDVTVRRVTLRAAWISRFLVQIGASLTAGYLYLHLAQLAVVLPVIGDIGASQAVATLSIVGIVAAFIAAPLGGWASDQLRNTRAILLFSGIAGAVALALLAQPPAWRVTMLAYGIWSAALAVFTTVHVSVVAQLLSGHRRRATLLGVFNLTGTLPGVLVPLLALTIGRGVAAPLSTIFVLAAVSSLAAGLAATRIRVSVP